MARLVIGLNQSEALFPDTSWHFRRNIFFTKHSVGQKLPSSHDPVGGSVPYLVGKQQSDWCVIDLGRTSRLKVKVPLCADTLV